jgi:transcriptional regulator with XRE-family HTH domain
MTSKVSKTHQATVSTICKHLGSTMREARKNSGKLQKTLADELGVSVPTYQDLEAGKTTVSMGTLVSALVWLQLSDTLLEITATSD